MNEVASGGVTGVVNPKILALLQRSLSVHEGPGKVSSKKPVDAASKLQKDCHKKNVETEKGKIPENPRGAKKYPGV